MDVCHELEPNDLARWRTSGEVLWKERLQAVNPRFQISVRPEISGLVIEVRPDSYSDGWRYALDWPVTLDQAIAAVEEVERDYEAALDTFRWFRKWITASMAEHRPGSDATTACLAFGYVSMSLAGNFVDHSLAIVDAVGERVVPPSFAPVSADQAEAWSYRFHADGMLDIRVGDLTGHEVTARQLARVVGDETAGVVSLKTWETPFRDLGPLLVRGTPDC